MQQKALLLISGAYQISGGIAAVNRSVIRALSNMGYEQNIYVLCESYELKSEYIPEHLRHTYICFNNKKVPFTRSVYKELFAHHYDIVMVDQINIASLMSLSVILNRQTYFVWLFGTEVFPPRPDFEGWLGLRLASKRIAISKFTKDIVLSSFPGLPVQVCELALDPDFQLVDLALSKEPKMRALTLPSLKGSMQELTGHVVLNVGRMDSHTRYKGQDELLLAFPTISAQFPDCQLVLAGDGDDRARIIEMALSLPDEFHHRIFIPGFVSDELLDQLYRRCYLFAMPSSGEGFGLVYLEAMARGKPCLGSRRDAAQCVIRDGETGLLVNDPRSVQEVADKVLFLLQNRELAAQMGQAGFELVQSRYLFQHFEQRFSQIIR